MRPMLFATTLLGCGPVEQEYRDAAVPDEAAFAAEVEPVLERLCANPSCHGRPERPLSVYAPRRFRADPARLFLDEPLTSDEIFANYRSASGFAQGIAAPDDSLLLRKPLGRAYHAAGTVLFDTDPEARAIRDWLWSAW
jgi:hypothetical protein